MSHFKALLNSFFIHFTENSVAFAWRSNKNLIMDLNLRLNWKLTKKGYFVFYYVKSAFQLCKKNKPVLKVIFVLFSQHGVRFSIHLFYFHIFFCGIGRGKST